MGKPDKTLRGHTAHLALGVFALVAVMLIVYAVIGKLRLPVVLGAVYAGVLGVANFFVMGLMVNSVAERMAEKQRTEQEISEMTIQMRNRMRVSYNLRMIALFLLLVLGIAVLHFDPLATILAAFFPSLVIRVMQFAEAKKAPASEGSEQL